jgi:20S proteasome alpha/beta subunit
MHELTSFPPMPAGSCIFGDVEAGTGGIVLGADTRATEGPIVADKVRRPGSD